MALEIPKKVPCQFKDTDACPVFRVEGECYEDRHHKYWPADQYTTRLEKTFRNLGRNIITICRNLHNIEHHTMEIPEKPSVQMMRQTVAEVRAMKEREKKKQEKNKKKRG